MSFFSFSEKDLTALEPLLWPAKEVVEFVCLDYKENATNGTLILNTMVLTGDHTGKLHTMFIDNRDNTISQKIRVQFALAFWSAEELRQHAHNPAKLVNRKFSAVAGMQRPSTDGTRVFQGFGAFKDLGPYEDAGTTTADFTDENGNPRF